MTTDPLTGDVTDPQSLNRYAYVINQPTNLVDPKGMDNCVQGKGAGRAVSCDNGGNDGQNEGDCQLDGFQWSCTALLEASAGGAAVECPNDYCGNAMDPFTCLADVCGYYTPAYLSTHLHDWNGVLYSDSEWAEFISQAVDAQRNALASAIFDAIQQANPQSTVSWIDIYLDLTPQKTRGGNVDFAFNPDDLSLLSFLPGYDRGGCEWTCRAGSVPSIHMNNGLIHLDSANWEWGYGLGFLIHFFVDMGIGNINPSVPLSR